MPAVRSVRSFIRKAIGAARAIAATGFRPWWIARRACNLWGAAQRPWEIARLLRIIFRARPSCVLEIGVGKGGTLRAWARASARDALLVGVDAPTESRSSLGPPAPSEVERLIKAEIRPSQRVELIRGDSHSAEVRQSVVRALGGRPVELLFLDGDHSYEGVRRDFEEYAPLVCEGGIIAFHDIVPDFETRYGRKTACWAGEVYRFWGELSSRCGGAVAIVEDPSQDGFGIGVIRRARDLR